MLTKEEYTAFLHPEEYEHMKEVVVDETLNDIDKDKDGFVSLEEYIGKSQFNHESHCENFVSFRFLVFFSFDIKFIIF